MLNIFSDINASAPKSMLLLTFKFIFSHQNKPSMFKGNYSQLQNRTFPRNSIIQGVLGVPQKWKQQRKIKGFCNFFKKNVYNLNLKGYFETLPPIN